MRPSAPDRVGDAAVWVLLLAPAVVLPGLLDRFVMPTLAAVGAGLLLALRSRAVGALPRWVPVGVAVGATWLVVAALTGDAPWAQLVGRWPRYEGLLAFPVYAGALAAGAALLGPGADVGRLRAVPRATSVLAVAVGVVSVLQAVGVTVLSSTAARAGSLLGNASDQGAVGVVALAVPVAHGAAGRGPAAPPRRGGGTPPTPLLDRPWVRWAGTGAAAATVVLSGSRGALLGAAVVLLGAAVLVMVDPRRRGRRRPALLGVAAVVIGTAGSALLVPATAARLTGTSPLAGVTVTGRRLLWADTLDLLAARPWTGVGPSGFVDAIPAFHGVAWAQQVGSADPPDSPHAWPLQAAVAGGVPFAVLAVVAVLALLVIGVRRVRVAADAAPAARGTSVADRSALLSGALLAVAGYLTTLSTHFTSPTTTPLVAVLAGALLAVGRRGPGRRWVRAARTAATALAAAWLLLVVLALVGERQTAVAYAAMDTGAVGPGGAVDEAFARAQALRPWDPDVAVMAAHAFATAAGEGLTVAADPAATWADAALARVPSSTTALLARATAAEATGDVAEADLLLTELLARAPVDAESYLRRGVVRAGLERHDEAEADFREAARLAPTSPVPWQNLAVLHGVTGDEAARVEALREAAARETHAPAGRQPVP